jgi:TetR/AcrR family transcriptional regulator, regulator of cefoperazone and chloramphenicol sensitivity
LDQGAARQRLIDAGIALFGRHGLEGTSTRDIARRAGTNIAGIAYHFGGKKQLYLACAGHIATTIGAGVAAGLAGLTPPPPVTSIPAEELRSILTVIARFMLATPEIAAFARFVMREQMDPSPAFDILYTSFMEPMHRRLCMLWAMATGGQADSERAKLKVFTLFGQIFFFRLARAGALRRLKTIIGLVGESLEALIAAETGEGKA